MSELDKMVLDNLSASLGGNDIFSDSIQATITAGRYAHLLCSTISAIPDHITTTLDGFGVENEFSQYCLLSRFRYLLFPHLGGLISTVLESLEFKDPGGKHFDFTQNAHIAAFILWFDLEHFRRSLRNGRLAQYNHVSSHQCSQSSKAFQY